jgi:O-antigen ligase
MEFIALFGSFVLSSVCLRRDTRLERDVSSAIWLPTLWMMRVASRSFNLWIPGSLSSWGDPIVLSVLTFMGLMVLFQRTHALGLFFHENRALWIFLIFMSMSVLWTDDVSTAFKRWFRDVGDVTMALIVLTEKNPFASLLCVIRRSVLSLIPLSLVFSLYFPNIGQGEGGSWIGVTIDKNWLGLLCVLSTSFLLWNWAMRKRQPELAMDIRLAGVPFEIPFLALSLYLLSGGAVGGGFRSSTAIVLLALAVGLFYLTDYVRKRNIRIGSLVAVVVLAVLFLQALPRLTGHRTLTDHIIEDVLHKDVNLTDRTDFWPLLLKKGMRHPWLGCGFDSFFSPQMQDEVQSELASTGTYFRPSQAHNGYLEVFLNLGVVGLLFLGLTIYGAFKGINRLMQHDFEFGRIRLILLIVALVSNYTEASFARPTEFVWFLFLLVAINPGSLPVQARA